RRMAREVVDKVVARLEDMGFGEHVRPCETATRPLRGAFAAGADLDAEAVRLAGARTLPADVAAHLVRTYGTHAETVLAAGARSHERVDPELPYLWCEIDHAIREETAVTVTDVLWRRVPIFLQARDQGLGICDQVARRLAAA